MSYYFIYPNNFGQIWIGERADDFLKSNFHLDQGRVGY